MSIFLNQKQNRCNAENLCADVINTILDKRYTISYEQNKENNKKSAYVVKTSDGTTLCRVEECLSHTIFGSIFLPNDLQQKLFKTCKAVYNKNPMVMAQAQQSLNKR